MQPLQSSLWNGGAVRLLPTEKHRADLLRLYQLRTALTYPGWREHFQEAERAYITNPEDLEDMHLFQMEERQRIHMGIRSHERLKRLDSLRFTYPGHQLDIRRVEEGHVLHKSGCFFDDALQGMINKENMFTSDRSHPDLVQLDRLKRALSYPGWEQDFYIAERSHLTHPGQLKDNHIFKLIEKQRMHYGDRSHARLRQLDACSWTYPGWQADKRVAEAEHVRSKKSPCFDPLLKSMKYRQLLFEAMERRCNKSKDSPESNEKQKVADPSGSCVICLTEPKSHAFIPCGHHCACELCALEAFGRTRTCPICRQEADTVTQIYFS